jgi:dienelactone hydrolase
MSQRILFFHGLESGPNGNKANRLRAHTGYVVMAPELPTRAVLAYRDEHPTASLLPLDVARPSLRAAEEAIEVFRPDVVVGSSFGGALASRLAAQGSYGGALVLLAPAGRKLFGDLHLPKRNGRVVVVHGRGDDVVPMEDSLHLAHTALCDVLLHLVDDDHRLHASVENGLMEEAIAWAKHLSS